MKYKTITVREDLYQKLKSKAQERGFSIPDFINHMLIVYEEFIEWAEKLQVLAGALTQPAVIAHIVDVVRAPKQPVAPPPGEWKREV